MFNAEPIEPWTEEERLEFEQHVRERHRRTTKAAAWAGLTFLILCVVNVPFSVGRPLHRHHRYIAEILLYSAGASLVWLGMKVSAIYSSWQAAPDTRREME